MGAWRYHHPLKKVWVHPIAQKQQGNVGEMSRNKGKVCSWVKKEGKRIADNNEKSSHSLSKTGIYSSRFPWRQPSTGFSVPRSTPGIRRANTPGKRGEGGKPEHCRGERKNNEPIRGGRSLEKEAREKQNKGKRCQGCFGGSWRSCLAAPFQTARLLSGASRHGCSHWAPCSSCSY